MKLLDARLGIVRPAGIICRDKRLHCGKVFQLDAGQNQPAACRRHIVGARRLLLYIQQSPLGRLLSGANRYLRLHTDRNE